MTRAALPLLLPALLLCGAFAASAQAGAADTSKPNILLIVADDLGREWLGSYGSDEGVTPNLDRLAAEGRRWETAWTTPLCTPTRLELLTGRYPFRTGWTVHHDTPRWGGQNFDPEREICFARPLRDAGYATAIAGKWQINDLRSDPKILERHGWSRHAMWPGAESKSPRKTERYWDPLLQIDGERPERPEGFGPDIFTGYLEEFIRRGAGKPWLAYYPMVLTHEPLTTTPLNPAEGQSREELFRGMVRYMDHEIGRLLHVLDETGQREKTLVIFTTDNGSPSRAAARWKGRQVKGQKGKLSEWGTHAPLITRWPGRGGAGAVVSQPMDFSDFFPTFVELAGVKLPRGVKLDGYSLAGLLRGESEKSGRAWVFSQYGERRSVGDGRYRLYSDGAFFDVQEDPMEERDLRETASGAQAVARRRLAAALESLPPNAPPPGGA